MSYCESWDVGDILICLKNDSIAIVTMVCELDSKYKKGSNSEVKMCNDSGKVKALMVYADADEMSSSISKICGDESEWIYSPSRNVIYNKDELWLVHVVSAENIPAISGRTYDVVIQSGRAVVTDEHAELIATRLTNKGSNMSFDVLDELVGIRDFVFFSSILDWK